MEIATFDFSEQRKSNQIEWNPLKTTCVSFTLLLDQTTLQQHNVLQLEIVYLNSLRLHSMPARALAELAIIEAILF